ncbi:tripartite tricarboxylate transporter substrate binding protein [Roseomonas hellenica]|uniref:Tripartite tricarboxylate transporter substrate binding protein n=1 Tax=Plastoroseomonas hellenica TaxID=2687306 RepID=A0ABS5EU26_9PROT|nr:tripartite tricarboxylate transporter substrate binding protein [Plastoroseomonas hellenica]MBR0663808.1 tripartite tricarboxylate transporter substrate binding protein [Plastoroseomonas hellenica]
MRKRDLLQMVTGAAAVLAGAAPRFAVAQSGGTWAPDRPLRLIVPFAAGGPADIFGRLFAAALARELAQPVVVENRTGAGGVIGHDAVAKAAPDGYTLGITGPGALSIAPALPQQRMPFDVWRDLAHLCLVVRVPEVVVVNARSGPRDLAALIAMARARRGEVTYGSAGIGSITHLASALLATETRMEVTHIPYRGAAPAATDLLAGRFTFMTADVPVLKPHIDSGDMRPLAVTTAHRIASLPEVATTAELGFPRVNSDNWYGLAAPSAIAAPVRQRLEAAAVAALRDPTLARGFAQQGGEAAPLTGEDYMSFLRAEAGKWEPLVRQSGAESL